MSNKKNEDLKMSRMDKKDLRPVTGLRVDSGMGSILSQLENNPSATVLAYYFSSISTTVVNKYVVICMAAILVLKQMGLIPNLAILESSKAKRWLPVSVFFAALNGVRHSVETAAAISTLNAGYAWMGLNVFCTALYVLGTRKFINSLNFKDWDRSTTMFYNNLLSLPIMIICSLATEDWSSANLAQNFPAESRHNLMIGMLYSGLGAIFISYSSAWCIRKTSSTTYSFVGYLNKLPLAISVIVFFDAPVTFGSVSAILLGFFSGLVYGYSKMKQRE
ncbi:hypothetical protein VE04_07682 [Pseudogymnoascus sp. 24MN13]|nr:hypothetical protein VE04_07682 [Pseudogymnoascus sp. 24MN13]